MLVVMKPHATAEEVQAVCDRIERLGYRPHPMPGAQRTAIGITGNQGAVEQDALAEMSGVAEVIKVSKPYKLVSRDVKEEDTVIRFPGTDAVIGGRNIAVIAGPCSIESREQAFAVAEQVAKAGAQFLRGGAYKPRTSPYAFQGMGEAGAAHHGRGAGALRTAHRDRGAGQRVAGAGRGVCRHDPDRRAQYAELFAIEARGPLEASRCC